MVAHHSLSSIMFRFSFLWFICLLLVGASAVFYFEYRYYRIPLLLNDFSTEVSQRVPIETNGTLHSIDLDEIIVGTFHEDDIPAIDEPVYESIASADVYLNDDGYGLVIEGENLVRFYPYQILVWHQAVNDTFGKIRLLVSYCPLCFEGSVYQIEKDSSEAFSFGVSGKLWNNNTLLYDRSTHSLWSQVLGEAVVGPRTGAKLERYPFYSTTWASFKEAYSSAEVLSRNTGYVRDYTQDPYERDGYYSSSAVWYPLSHEDERLEAKEIVYGYQSGDFQKAYSQEWIKQAGSIQDTIGSQSITIMWDEDLQTARFLSGPSEDSLLETEQLLQKMFWFCWATMYPQTKAFEN
ncbi:MAG: hypothetical protein UT30_C0005G0040 [Candidatus Uhrbacteria bacterium GW2011_GWF2_39_13]|uniref:DUF3179 domain-containing protein n=1 Tax=Candidatus Uhrbacteria bacterium GW2011_GWF2_39_13 TaxID=1618995 RepID=A0A0G0QSR5_9BACT|nr:MAG: hypothetical protein UT30_C0005G0040 [Candidatus Uhrbacteria bacterium GW2011_GWF2_39_13]HAU66439.1 hypothetical protein [Candidatus Uhrbacteria bacterium]